MKQAQRAKGLEREDTQKDAGDARWLRAALATQNHRVLFVKMPRSRSRLLEMTLLLLSRSLSLTHTETKRQTEKLGC